MNRSGSSQKQHHNHQRNHSHHSHHSHLEHGSLKSIRWAFLLNLSFSILEMGGGIWAQSMALIANSYHDMGDAMILALAYFFERVSHSKTYNPQFSYGYRRLSTLSAVMSSLILMGGSLWIVYESIERWSQPRNVHSLGMFGFSILGLSVNYLAFRWTSKGEGLNEKSIHWHFIEDMLSWSMVFVTSILIYLFQWQVLDTLLGGVLAIVIFVGVFKNFKKILVVFLQASPAHLELKEIEKTLMQLDTVPKILHVHHLHLWSLDGEKHILTAHILLDSYPKELESEDIKKKIKLELKERYQVHEATLEIEGPSENCSDPHHEWGGGKC